MDQWNHSCHLISFRFLSHFISLHLTFILHHLTFFFFISLCISLHLIPHHETFHFISNHSNHSNHSYLPAFFSTWITWSLRSLHLRLPTKKKSHGRTFSHKGIPLGEPWVLGVQTYVVWVNYNELTTTSLEIIVSKGKYPQIAARFRLVNYYNLPRCCSVDVHPLPGKRWSQQTKEF